LVYYRLAGCFLWLNENEKAVDAFENGLRINSSIHEEINHIFPDALSNTAFGKLVESYSMKDLN
jgi:hypothetical protein